MAYTDFHKHSSKHSVLSSLDDQADTIEDWLWTDITWLSRKEASGSPFLPRHQCAELFTSEVSLKQMEVNVLLGKSSLVSKFDRKFPMTINSIFFSLTTKSLNWLEAGGEGNRPAAKNKKWEVTDDFRGFLFFIFIETAVTRNEMDVIQVLKGHAILLHFIIRARTLFFSIFLHCLKVY